MGSAISERVQLAKFCSSKDWSKAIRVLDSILSQSSSIQDICNRAFCYSQLELHKHVIKDCNKAIQLDPSLLQAYILKGGALSALGKKEDAVLVWEQGYEYALSQSADLKQLLELEELLSEDKHDRVNYYVNGSGDSSGPSLRESEAGSFISSKPSDTSTTGNNLSGKFEQSTKLGEKSGISCKLKNKIDTHDESRGKVDNNGKLDGHCNGALNGQSNGIVSSQLNGSGSSQTNGKYTILHKLNGDSNLCNESSEICKKSPLVSNKSSKLSEHSGKSSGSSDAHNGFSAEAKSYKSSGSSDAHNGFSAEAKSNKSSGSSDAHNGFSAEAKSNKSSGSSDAHNGFNAEAKSSKKFSVNRISKTKSISVDFRLSRGISKVNEGKYDSAVSIFDQVLNEDPTYPEALIGRGTAYAFQRELDAAISDFTRAIQSNPSAGEAWKRRGQARAALGESAEAIADLTKALEFEPNSADILHERGIVNFKFKNFCAAFEDLSACVQLDKDNKSAYTYLGLALSSIGEYKRAEEAHMKSIQLDPDFLEGHAHLTQLYQDLANTEKALESIQRVLQIDSRFAKAYYLQALLFHGMGDHRNAIKALSLGLSIESSNIEFLYLRASCHHALGEYKEAVKDYDATLDMELDSVEKFVLQCLAFYQKEIALYTASKFNIEFSWFDIDGDIDPFFKEYWCKRLHPKNVCEKVYRQPPLRESLRKGKLKKQDLPFTKTKMSLVHAADSIGTRIQYNCPGFLPNRRQHRMAGLAAIEIAQKVSKAWRRYINKSTFKNGKRARRKEKVNIASHNRGGAGCSTSTSMEAPTSHGINEDRSSGRFLMSWYDVYSLAVKWRQISEPCDPVVWVNKLSKEEFISGFGSHTPLILGQAKVVRYFPYFQRTLDVAKAVIMEKRHVYNKENKIIDLSDNKRLQHIRKAESCAELYRVVGEDFWLVTGCISTATEGRCLEGTRITLVKVGEHGFDFAIKTPCTPFRWEEFDEEMTSAWEALCNAYCGETYGSTDFTALEEVRGAILRLAYYWYNFMPLSRGSASVGLTVLIGLLLAANMEFTGSIPQGLQVDWEAILNSDPNSFMDSVKSWLYPALKVTTSWKDYPDVSTTFETTGSVVAALSTYNN